MEGLLTNYYEYHFLYISGIHHVESRERPGHGPDEAVLPPRHRHGPGDGRDDRLRQPLAGLHAAGDRPAVHHALRHRQRAGRLPRALQRDEDASARSRTRPCSRSGRCSPACPACRPRRRSAAASGPSSSGSTPTGSAPTTCRPTRSINALTAGNAISPSGDDPHRRRDADRAGQLASSRTSRSWPTIPIRPGAEPPSTSATSATVEDATDIPTGYALVNGRRAVYILVTKRADASTLAVVNDVKADLPEMQAVLPDDIKVSFEFDQSPYVTRAIAERGDRRGARGGADRADGAGLPARLAERHRRRAEHPARPRWRRSWRLWLTGQTINLMTLGGLALAVGILVDEATVEIENIHTQLDQHRLDRPAPCGRATRRRPCRGCWRCSASSRCSSRRSSCRGRPRRCSCRCRWPSASR